ncbi:MAG: acyl-CoA carboxylase subunit beta [Dehalococcoidia bacterium]
MNEHSKTFLTTLREQTRQSGGSKRIEAQHKRGKLTARERLLELLDPNSFNEIDGMVSNSDVPISDNPSLGDSVITGFGQIDGRTIFVYAQNFSVFGGSLSQIAAKKICKIMDLSIQNGSPCIGLIDSGGARIQEGIKSLAGYGDIFLRNVRSSGVIPQLSLILGPAAGGATYSPALTDFIFMTQDISQMYITGPKVVQAVTGEISSLEELGGTSVHSSKSGVAHFSSNTESDCFKKVRKLLSFLPANNMEEPPQQLFPEDFSVLTDVDYQLEQIIPDNPSEPYDMNEILQRILDNRDFFEIHSDFATNILVGFGRINGSTVGIVAQQPMSLAGVIDIDASVKAARFIRFCDSFNIPIITFADVPGFLPGVEQEHSGIIRHGAKLIFAYAEATVPKICVITRKAYGGAYIVMSSKGLSGDMNFAWPHSEIAVMGAEGAVDIIYSREISSSDDPDQKRSELISNYQNELMNPYIAAKQGFIDEVIYPYETRIKISNSLAMLKNKRDQSPPKKHGNIPL